MSKVSAANLDASAVAALLREFGQRAALRGGNPYRARAYSRAAESLEALAVPVGELVAQERLREIPGVGDARISSGSFIIPARTRLWGR
jgi:DNA polymerase (family X)